MKSLLFLTNAFKSKPIQWILLIIFVVGLIYFIGRYIGRNSFSDYKPKELPEEPNWSPDIYVEEAWSVLNGWTDLAADKEELFISLYALSDRQLTQVYNLYNSKYGKQDGMTLTRKIDEESNVFWTGRRNDLVKRLRNLKLI